jgi:uncharacterized protein with GYD domain
VTKVGEEVGVGRKPVEEVWPTVQTCNLAEMSFPITWQMIIVAGPVAHWRCVELIFITLAKFRKKPTKEQVAMTPQRIEQSGGKIISAYWTLGRYDAILTVEAPDEKTVLKTLLQFGDLVASETLVAIPRDEAIKLL